MAAWSPPDAFDVGGGRAVAGFTACGGRGYEVLVQASQRARPGASFAAALDGVVTTVAVRYPSAGFVRC